MGYDFNSGPAAFAPPPPGSPIEDNTTPPLPGNPKGAADSPLHNAVRQAFAAHPTASPGEIAQGLTAIGGVDPALAHRVVADVMGGGQSAPDDLQGILQRSMTPPIVDTSNPRGAAPAPQAPNSGEGGPDPTTPPMVSGALTPGDAGGAPGPWQNPGTPASGGAGPAPQMVDRTTPPLSPPASAMMAANADRLKGLQQQIDQNPPPNAYGPTAASANANRLTGLQGQIDQATPPAPGSPPPSMAPGSVPDQAAGSTTAAASPNDQTTPPDGSPTIPPGNFLDGMGGLGSQMTPPASTTPPVPQKPEGKGPNKWGTILQDLAPAAAALMIGSHNPAAGTAFLSNWQGAADAARTRADQQKQQGIENKRADQQETDRQTGLKIEQAKVDQAKAAAVGKLDQAAERQMWTDLNNATSGSAAMAIVNKYDPDGSKLSGLRQILIGKDGEPVDVNPYSTKAGTLAAKSAHDYAQDNHWSKQDAVAARRADDLAKKVGAQVDELEAVAGLDKSRTGYVDAQTKELVPMDKAIERLRNAQSTFLGVRTADQPGLDQSLENYRGDMGWAATTNATTNRDALGLKSALAQEGIRVDEARIQQIMGKDPTFNANMQLFKQALAQRQQAQSSATLAADPAAQKRIIDDIDGRITMLWGNIKGRVNGGGATPAAPAATATPSVPSVTPAGNPPAGRPTARSTAYRNGQAYKPTDTKTINGVTKTVAEWRQEYSRQYPGRKVPF